MDDIDRKIISKLQMNGRATLCEMAKTIGFTSPGIKRRLQKLLDQDAIKVTALLDPKHFGLCAAIAMLELESAEETQKVIDRFKDCPRVVQIFQTLGGYNLIALVVAEDQETLNNISREKCSIRSGTGIRRSEFYPIGEIGPSPFLPVREDLTHKGRPMAPCNVDCKSCSQFNTKKCGGCPTVEYYRGTL